MPNFDLAGSAALQASDGGVVAESYALPLNARVLLDDILPAGITDLTPLLASIAAGQALVVKSIGSSFRASLDGFSYSVRKIKMLYIDGFDAGVLSLNVNVTAPCRIQMLVGGD